MDYQDPNQPLESFDFTNTPENFLIPDMMYNFEVTNIKTLEGAQNKTLCNSCGTQKGKKMIVVQFTVLEPLDYAGAPVSEFFTIGTEADPCAHHTDTLASHNLGAINFRQLLVANNVPTNHYQQLLHKRCQRATIQVESDQKDSNGNVVGKRTYNNFAKAVGGAIGAYPLGTFPIGQIMSRVDRPSQRSAGQNPPGLLNSTVKCPRPGCGMEFTSGKELDDHMALHLAGA